MISGKRVQFVRAERVKQIIEKHRKINKWKLMEIADLSRSVYEKEAPYWLMRYETIINYDRKTGDWFLLETLLEIPESKTELPELTQ